MPAGVKIRINASDLLKWSRYFEQVPKKTKTAAARAMNAFGAQAVDVIVQHLAQKNNWQPEDVLRRILVKQATPTDLTFVMDASLVMPEPVDWQRPWLSRSDTSFEQNTLVKVITVDDGYDCDVCRQIAENGPYTMQQITDMQSKWFNYQPTGHLHAPGVRTNLVHPNAVLAGSRFMSYGAVTDYARAVFHGPAIKLRMLPRTTTIGPNHPMLTKRGWLAANQIREGDELVYDSRIDVFGSVLADTADSYLENMPLAEQVFQSLNSIGSAITVTGTRDDFHGDAVFCEDKIDIVRPTRPLLLELDPLGLEQFSELDFAVTNTELQSMIGNGLFDLLLESSFTASGSQVGGSGLFNPLFCSHSRPFDDFLFTGTAGNHIGLSQNSIDHISGATIFFGDSVDTLARFVDCHDFFRWERVLSRHDVDFHGLAFDASTASELYNSDGFVVHNCRCVTQPWSSYRRLAISMQGVTGSVGTAPQRLMTAKQLGKFVKDEMRIELRVMKASALK